MGSTPLSQDQRRLRRWRLVLYLRAFDNSVGRLLGHVVDVSPAGLCLISDSRMEVGRYFDLWLDVPQDDGARQRIMLRSESMWCRPDVNPDFFVTGMRLIDPGPDTVLRIQLLIDDLKF